LCRGGEKGEAGGAKDDAFSDITEEKDGGSNLHSNKSAATNGKEAGGDAAPVAADSLRSASSRSMSPSRSMSFWSKAKDKVLASGGDKEKVSEQEQKTMTDIANIWKKTAQKGRARRTSVTGEDAAAQGADKPSVASFVKKTALVWRKTSKQNADQRIVNSQMRGRSKLGEVVTSKSSSYMFVTALIQGIRASLRKTDLKQRQATDPLVRDDFDHFTKVEFILDQGQKCKFKDYAPAVFRQLRQMFGVDDESYLNSVGQQEGLSEISTQETGSKSGQKFLISHDGRYFMKTTTASEARFFMKVLPDYYRHMKDYRNSLLCRFFGLHRIKPGKMHLLIMGNIFDTERIIHQRYDLKGSTVGRSVSEAERKKPTVILKDLDFLNETRNMKIGAERKNILITQVRADCCFLQFLGVMDYSLLLGVHFRDANDDESPRVVETPNRPAHKAHHTTALLKTGSLARIAPEKTHTSDFQQHDGGWCSQETLPNGQTVTGKEIYFVGIIDYLQFYNTKKRAETILKGFTYSRQEISAVDPKFYSSRFCNFMCSMME